jgi:hypothetical protein
MPSVLSKIDNLSGVERGRLVEELTKLIENKKNCLGLKEWNIPNSPYPLNELETYGFPLGAPLIWLAKTEFPKKREFTTRDAVLVALADPQRNDKVATAFELNVARKAKYSRLNCRFEKLTDGIVRVRCLGAFAKDGVRIKAEHFHSFLDKREGHGLTRERHGRNRYVVLFDLVPSRMPAQWAAIQARLVHFAQLVEEFKNQYQRS